MIPKVIHYCWFGKGEMSALHQRCIDSWRKYCPDYELRIWNESNSDIDNPYCREALIQKKWAFIADYVRFDTLAKHGGIYLDSDVELIRSMDEILAYRGCVIARESPTSIATGFIACEPGDPVMQTAARLMVEDLSRQRVFAISPLIVKHAIALNRPELTTVLDEETFYPFNPYDSHRPRNAKQLMFSDITPATIGIHHYGKSVSWGYTRLMQLVRRIDGKLPFRSRWDISFHPFR